MFEGYSDEEEVRFLDIYGKWEADVKEAASKPDQSVSIGFD